MAIDYAALKAEITNDQSGLGYAAAPNNLAVSELLNAVRGTITVEKSSVPARELIGALAPAEYVALTQPQRDYLALLPALGAVDIRTGSSLRNALNSVFAAGSATRANYTALASRSGSRAEQVFGVDTRISESDVGQAKGMP